MSKKPPLTDSDKALWEQATQNMKPLDHKAVFVTPKRITMPTKHPTKTPEGFITESQPLKRKRRHLPVEARLDLHGHTQDQAYRELTRFLSFAQSRHFKCVLVITGKGQPHSSDWWVETGILKNLVPRWLNEEPNKQRVSHYAMARVEHGGSGALYVYLRKK